MKKQRLSLADQLSIHTGKTTMAQSNIPRAPRYKFDFKFINDLAPCARWRGDGIDHINVSPKAKTDLGRALHSSFDLRFNHDVFGNLGSVSRLWNQIDDLVGGKAINMPETQLPFLLMDAMWQKVRQYPKLAEGIKDNELPLDMYQYNDADMPFRNSMAYWWLEGLAAIRKALINDNTYPDFSSLAQGNIYSRKKILSAFLMEYVPNRRNAAEQLADDEAKIEAKPAESLVKELRSTPPLVIGMKKFSLTLDARTGKQHKRAEQLATPQVEEPGLAITVDPAKEGTDQSVEQVVGKTWSTKIELNKDGTVVKTDGKVNLEAEEGVVGTTTPPAIHDNDGASTFAETFDTQASLADTNAYAEVAKEIRAENSEVIQGTLEETTSDAPVEGEQLGGLEVATAEPGSIDAMFESGETLTLEVASDPVEEPLLSEETTQKVAALLNDAGTTDINTIGDKLVDLLVSDKNFLEVKAFSDFEVDFSNDTHKYEVSAVSGGVSVVVSALAKPV